MGKPRMYGYFKPVTPNCRAWCPKKMKPKQKDKKEAKAHELEVRSNRAAETV